MYLYRFPVGNNAYLSQLRGLLQCGPVLVGTPSSVTLHYLMFYHY